MLMLRIGTQNFAHTSASSLATPSNDTQSHAQCSGNSEKPADDPRIIKIGMNTAPGTYS